MSSIQTEIQENSEQLSKSGPKTFEEIKKLVKCQKAASVSASLSDKLLIRSLPLDSDVNSDISDDSDDETFAPSITTEVNDEHSTNEYQMSPFRAVISRLRSSPAKEYSTNQYLEGNNLTNQASGLYDSLLSVNTVIENPSYNNHGDTSLLANSIGSEYFLFIYFIC